MRNYKVELTAGWIVLPVVKITRGIFLGDAGSPSSLLIAMKSLNFILRKCTECYKFAKSHEKNNLLMYIDDIPLFAK